MATIIPCRTDLTHYELQIVLDGTSYTFEFRWSPREDAWFLDVREEGGEPIYIGLKVVVDFGIGKRCADGRFPPGLIMAVDTSAQSADPGISDLGARVQLLYFDKAELPISLDDAFATLEA